MPEALYVLLWYYLLRADPDQHFGPRNKESVVDLAAVCWCITVW